VIFPNINLDSSHGSFVTRFRRGVLPHDEAIYARWWPGLFPELPPRLANDCIWLAVEVKRVDPW
jgi:hypothetical protein